MSLSRDDIDLVRTSYIRLSGDLQRAGDVFYEKLFELAPETRNLFVVDMSTQSVKLMSTLGLVVSQLQNAEELEPLVRDLALRHLAYGVERAHYALVRQALIKMLETLLEDTLSDELLSAWMHAYDSLADVMLEAAYPAPSQQVTV
ncbi:globin domain-containing protein [uncultured Roseibium sp.]|uniref:globin domain-containing protein n=1 Tax=uncultured Roseibium sp. TaxID=1936171 RepID=UPI00260520D6|nr:globin domain-containing protein [uncultured Roseibium sp.]